MCSLGDELRKKIETEQSEIDKLRQELVEVNSIRQDLYSSDEASSASSSDSEDDGELQEELEQLVRENQVLEVATCV